MIPADSNRAAQIGLVLICTIVSAPAGAQSGARETRWRAEISVGFARPFVQDGNGTTVTPGISPVGGLSAAWRTGVRTALTLGGSASTSSLRLEDGGGTWSGGRTWQVDVMGGVERAVAGCHRRDSGGCTTARGALGFTWLRGPNDVLPFRFGGAAFHPAIELGAAVRLPMTRPLSATVLARAFRLGGSTTDDPIGEPGTAFQFRIGGRHDW